MGHGRRRLPSMPNVGHKVDFNQNNFSVTKIANSAFTQSGRKQTGCIQCVYASSVERIQAVTLVAVLNINTQCWSVCDRTH